MARFQLLQWHREGQAAFHVFHPPTEHGDAAVLAAQRWLADHYAVAGPVEEMVRCSGLSASTFKRRFKAATGHTAIGYVQRVRVEEAKRLLETSAMPVEEVSWTVGYEDAASFRRLFKRLAGMPPGEYRRRFRLPELALGSGAAQDRSRIARAPRYRRTARISACERSACPDQLGCTPHWPGWPSWVRRPAAHESLPESLVARRHSP